MTIGSILLWLLAAALAGVLGVLGYFAFVTARVARQAERLVPAPGRFVTIDGHRIHYFDRGQGRPIVFIHGLGGTQFHFLPLLAALERDFRLVALDRPGSGYSTRVGLTPASPKQHAAFIARFIDELGLERPLLVGHSLGGAIALAVALDHPDKISGLALIAPLTRYQGEVAPEFADLDIRSPLLRRFIAHTIAVPRSLRNGARVLACVFGPQEPPADYAVAGGAFSALRPSHFFGTSTDLMAVDPVMLEQQERYGELKLPVGVIYGTADRVLDWEKHGKLLESAVRGLDAEYLDGVGHMPQYAQPERVAAFVLRMAAKAFGTH